MTGYVQIVTSTQSKEGAEKIARDLVEKRLAACVQIVGPMTSTYRWQGKIETTEEWLCLIKSKTDLYEEVERTINELHTYETPEILALPVVTGSRTYLDWLRAELQRE
jgi:periplasmic divalent cation tolerance protein